MKDSECAEAVLCCELGEEVAFEAECFVRLLPVVVVVLGESVVVQVNVQRVELVVAHCTDEVLEVV